MGKKGYDFWVELRLKETGLAKGLGTARDAAKSAMSSMTGLEKATHRVRAVWSQFGDLIAFWGVSAALIDGAKKAAEFETAMARVGVVTGVEGGALTEYGDRVKAMAADTGISAITLAQALGAVDQASANIDESMQFMDSASKLAVAGFTTVEDAANSLSGVLSAYGMGISRAIHLSNVFAVVQREAKMTAGDFGRGLTEIAKTTASYGVTVETVAAAVSAAALSGMTDSQSFAAVNQVVAGLGAPGRLAQRVFKQYGLEMDAAKFKSMGLVGALTYIRKGVGDNQAVLKRLLGAQEAVNLAMTLTSEEGGKKFQDVLERATSSATDLYKAYDRMGETVEQRMKRVKVAWDQVLDTFGEGVLDVLGLRSGDAQSKITVMLNDVKVAMRDFFRDWPHYIDQAERLLKVFLAYEGAKGALGMLSTLAIATGGGKGIPGAGGGKGGGAGGITGSLAKGVVGVSVLAISYEASQMLAGAFESAARAFVVDRMQGRANLTMVELEAKQDTEKGAAARAVLAQRESAAKQFRAAEGSTWWASLLNIGGKGDERRKAEVEKAVQDRLVEWDKQIDGIYQNEMARVHDSYMRSLAESEEAGARQTAGYETAADYLDAVATQQSFREPPPVQVSIDTHQTFGLEPPLAAKGQGSVRARIDRGEGEARLVSPRYRMTLVREGAGGAAVHPLEDRVIDAAMLNGG